MGVISVGNRRDYPRECWGPLDFEREREELARIGEPLTHVPGGPAPDLKFSVLHSRAIDELVAKHVGRPGIR